MNCVVDGITNINELNEYKIIECIDVYNSINVYENNNVNINIKINSQTIEIISINIKSNEINIKKICNNNVTIYIINFITYINFKLINNNQIQDIEFKNMYSKSFIYKDIEKLDLDLYPINFEFENIDNKIHFTINFIIVDKSKDIGLNHKPNEDTFINEDTNNKHYSYIDINQEFT